MSEEMHFPENWDDFGPKMQVLSEREKRFCWAYLTGCMVNNGHYSATEAAREAGYSDGGNGGGIRVRGHELMHRERVLEAMAELGQRELRGLIIPSLMVLRHVVDSPMHVDQVKAAMSVLNRTGLTETATVEHKHTVDTKELEALARRLAQESGIDARKLLGRDTKTIDVTPVEVKDGE